MRSCNISKEAFYFDVPLLQETDLLPRIKNMGDDNVLVPSLGERVAPTKQVPVLKESDRTRD